MNLSVAYITARKEHHVEWMMDSLATQMRDGDRIEMLICDLHFDGVARFEYKGMDVIQFEPKPSVWAGRHRLTKEQWWDKPSQMNSAICMAKNTTLAFVDDRAVLGPEWLQAVRDSIAGNYLALGTYAKHHGMQVENGKIINHGRKDGEDRRGLPKTGTHRVHAGHFFGCCWAAPIEWILQVNGIEERCCALGFEDVITGHFIDNHNLMMRFDSRLLVTQDRTPSECGPVMKRTSKERFQYDQSDKTWTALKTFAKDKQANPGLNMREMREQVLGGKTFPHHNGQPSKDWYDGADIPKGFDLI